MACRGTALLYFLLFPLQIIGFSVPSLDSAKRKESDENVQEEMEISEVSVSSAVQKKSSKKRKRK
jgi:hypothetical protein